MFSIYLKHKRWIIEHISCFGNCIVIIFLFSNIEFSVKRLNWMDYILLIVKVCTKNVNRLWIGKDIFLFVDRLKNRFGSPAPRRHWSQDCVVFLQKNNPMKGLWRLFLKDPDRVMSGPIKIPNILSRFSDNLLKELTVRNA